jgi:polyhydroxyalkanoate synthesis regulator phasin
MVTKKQILSTIASVVVIGSVVAVPVPAYAAGNGWFGGGNFFSKFVDFFAQKFGLDKTQVTNAMTDFRTQQTKDREKKRLDPLVTQGKITADQETAIITELDALRAKYPFNPQDGKTPDQRNTDRQNMQNEWKAWAQANNIDPTIAGPVGMRMMGGMRGGKNWGGK